jgi:hypothetical protein
MFVDNLELKLQETSGDPGGLNCHGER